MTRESQLLTLVSKYVVHNPEVIASGVRRSRRGKLIIFFYISHPDVRDKLPKMIEELPVYFYDERGRLIKD